MASKKVDIKKLKSRLKLSDYKKVMEALGIPLYMEGNDHLIYYSGDKYKDFQNHSAKLYLYTDTMLFVGYTSSRSYDLISLVQTRLNLLGQTCNFMDAVKFIMATVGLETDDVVRLNQKKHVYDWESQLSKYVRFRSKGSSLPSYDPIILTQLDECYPQAWIDEGISVESMEKYFIRYYERTNSTVIPCFSEYGELLGVRVRNWQPEEIDAGRKYVPLQLLDNTIYKFPTNATFYGINYNKPIIENSGVVILGESEKMTLKLDTWYGEKNVALSMFGKNLGLKRRNDLIKMNVKKIIYVPDNDWIGKGDEAYNQWEKEVFRFAKQFKGYAQVEVVWDNLGLLDEKENATDKDFDTWKRLYENREVIE